MPNRYYREDDKDAGGKGLSLPRSSTSLPLKDKSFKWPALPGRPRKIHKPLGRTVKTAVEKDY